MASSIQFFGGVETVTGSKYLLKHRENRSLVDAGLFQGQKKFRKMNWAQPAFDLDSLDSILLTHTHIDHAGYLPRLVKLGYRNPIFATPATIDLAHILLMDAAKIQEEDARYANRKRYSRHNPALPLYTSENVSETLRLFEPIGFKTPYRLTEDMEIEMINVGHILGSAMIRVKFFIRRQNDCV